MQEACGRRRLNEQQRDDLLADLIAYTWELSLRYDPDQDHARARGREPGFGGWAIHWLRFRVIDWVRKTEGRTRYQFGPNAQHIRVEFRSAGGVYEKQRREVVSLDQLDDALGPSSMDAEAHSDVDLGRVLLRGDSREAWEDSGVGEPEDERTAA
jgi:hypothetical protein